MKISDISHYQGIIDWSAAAKELDFCILRASVGSNLDTRYVENAAGCKANGVPFHAYHYLKATTEESAVTEAQHFYNAASPANPLFYVADVEWDGIPVEKAKAITSAFIAELKRLGAARTAIYVGHHLYTKFNLAVDEVEYLWIPRYGKNSGVPEDEYKPVYACDLWQYTSEGTLAGVSGGVDLNQLNGDKGIDFFTRKGEDNMFTNVQLAAWALAVYDAKWVYWYGTCGYKCTSSLYTSKKAQYPTQYTSDRTSGYNADIANGKMCADCVGVIKAFFWKGGELSATNTYKGNNCPDVSANGMYKLCTTNGLISTIPDIPGIVVWKDGHIGIYVGNGYTVEMKGFAYDCVKAKVSAGSWTNWGKLPDTMLTYTSGTVVQPTYKLGDRTLSKGDEGADVTELQTALKTLGYDLGTYGTNKDGVDGDFGAKTQSAVIKLQASAGLTQTGVFDTATYKALLEALNPTAPTHEPDIPDEGSAPAFVLIIEGDESTLRAVQSKYGGTLAQVDSVTIM